MTPGRRLHLSLRMISLLHCPFVSHCVEIERGGRARYLLLSLLLLLTPALLSPLRFCSLFRFFALLLEPLLLRDLELVLQSAATPFP